MNILLLYPEKENNKKSILDRFSSFLFKSNTENIYLVEISVYLPIIWEEKLVDLNVDKLNPKDLSWADHIILCADKTQSKSTRETIRKCKTINKKVVLCGNAVQDSDAEYNLIDHFVPNAAGFEVFSNDLANNTLQKVYKPIFEKTNGIPFQAYSLWGIVGKFSRAIQSHPA